MQKVVQLLRILSFHWPTNEFIISSLLIVTGVLFALETNGQNLSARRISLNLNDASVKVSLMEIQKRSNIKFIFDKDLDKYANVKIHLVQKDISVKAAIEQVLKNTNLQYVQMNDNVMVNEKTTAKSPNVQAGRGSGTLKGRIVEFETSQPLPGASILIAGLNKGGQSDNNGYYKLSDIPAGKYTIQVSYVSYRAEKIEVEIKTGKEETYDIKLQGSNSLQEVEVSSIRKTRAPVAHATEKQVLEQIKQASVVVSAISSEQISKSADRNAAEAVRKVSGITVADDRFVIVRGLNPRYNLTYLNDNVAPSTEIYSRAFALDLIPARIIDRIMVYKSPGPETLGDATGGVVKIYTKDARSVKHLDIELQMGLRPGTTFNSNFLTYNGGKLDFLGIDDGSRKLPTSVPGYDRLSLAQLSPSQYARTFNSTLTYRRMTAIPNIQLTANYYNSFKVFGKALSTLTSFSYKNEALKLSVHRQQGIAATGSFVDRKSDEDRNTQTAQLNLLQNFVLKLRDNGNISFKNFLLQQGQNSTISRVSWPTAGLNSAPNFSYNKDNILSFNQRFLYAGNLGGLHYYGEGKHQLQWNTGYTYGQQSTPDQRVIRLTAPTSFAAEGDQELLWRARGQNLSASDAYEPIPSQLGIISRLWMRNSEGNYNASVDYTYKWKPWLSLRAGAFQQWKERRLFRRVYTVHEGDNTNPDNTYYQPGTGHYLDPQIVRFRAQDLNQVWSEEYLRDDYSGLRVYDRTSGSDSYLGTEQNSSGYFALHFTPLDRKFEVYGGLRYEYNRQQIGAAIPKPVPTEINTPVYIDNPMKTWLPSVNASWRPNESWVVRAAYGKTVNRTEFREVAPYQELDFENNTIVSGNENLKSATVNNYDFRVEFYPRNNAKGETISAGIFYKDLKNPIERINTSNRVENVLPSISYQNASSATIQGLEIEVNKKLDFIPGKLFRDLSFIGNLTLIKSKTQNDTTVLASLSLTSDDKRPLQGQAPYIINAGLYYDNAAWGTKIAAIYSTSGQSIYAAGRGFQKNDFAGFTYRGSLIELPRHVLDISISQRLIKSLQAKLSIQNLLNQPIRIAEDYNFTNKYEPERKKEDQWTGDNISSGYNPRRYFVLSLSYSL